MIDPTRENDVLLAFVHNGNVATCFMNSVLGAFSGDVARGSRGLPRRLFEYFDASGPYIHDNRARVARYFLDYTDKQWLWFLDNDIQFPEDSLPRLLSAAEEHGTHILGGAYWNQYPGSSRYLSWLVVVQEKGFVAVPEFPKDRSVPVAVDALGMGCTLIHRDVLEAVRDQYPNDPWDTFAADILLRFEDGGMLVVRSPEDVDPEIMKDRTLAEDPIRLGEDVTFCMRARKAGYCPHGLPSLEVGHFKPHFMDHGRRDVVREQTAHGRLNAGAHQTDHKEDLAHAAV